MENNNIYYTNFLYLINIIDIKIQNNRKTLIINI